MCINHRSHSRRAKSRRDFLKGSAAFLGAMTFGLPSVLRAQQNPARKLLIVTCNGGWDVSFHLDPKPTGLGVIDVPAGSISTSGDLSWYSADACAGVVDNFFGAHSDVASIVRGISVRSISHDVCIRRMLTGSASESAPDMGVLAANTHGSALPAPYLTLGAVSFPGVLEGASVRQGTTNQLALAHKFAELDAAGLGQNWPSDDEQALLNAFLQGEGERMKGARGQFGANRRKTEDFIASVDRVQGLSENSASLGQPYAVALDVQTQIVNALTMLEQGVAWSVNVSTGFAWDHHDPAAAPTGTYEGAQGLQNQQLWPALSYLASELKSRPGSTAGSKLIDEVTVVVVSEMTRTPKLNDAGGKDR